MAGAGSGSGGAAAAMVLSGLLAGSCDGWATGSGGSGAEATEAGGKAPAGLVIAATVGLLGLGRAAAGLGGGGSGAATGVSGRSRRVNIGVARGRSTDVCSNR